MDRKLHPGVKYAEHVAHADHRSLSDLRARQFPAGLQHHKRHAFGHRPGIHNACRPQQSHLFRPCKHAPQIGLGLLLPNTVQRRQHGRAGRQVIRAFRADQVALDLYRRQIPVTENSILFGQRLLCPYRECAGAAVPFFLGKRGCHPSRNPLAVRDHHYLAAGKVLGIAPTQPLRRQFAAVGLEHLESRVVHMGGNRHGFGPAAVSVADHEIAVFVLGYRQPAFLGKAHDVASNSVLVIGCRGKRQNVHHQLPGPLVHVESSTYIIGRGARCRHVALLASALASRSVTACATTSTISFTSSKGLQIRKSIRVDNCN